MGYYVSYNIEATIDMSKEAEALAAINALHDPEKVKSFGHGGSFSGGQYTERWYSWVRNPEPGGFSNLFEAMTAWRFALDKDGTFYFDGGKVGQEEILFEALTPFLSGDIYARGEDDYEWGFRFQNGKMTELQCKRDWVEV